MAARRWWRAGPAAQRRAQRALEREGPADQAIQAGQPVVARAHVQDVGGRLDLLDRRGRRQRRQRQAGAVQRQDAALGRGEELREARHRDIAPGPDRSRAGAAEHRMRAVLDQRDALRVAPGAHAFHRLRQAEVMRHEQRPGPRRHVQGQPVQPRGAVLVDRIEDRVGAERLHRRDHRRAVVGGQEHQVAGADGQALQREQDGRASTGGEPMTRVVEQAGLVHAGRAGKGAPADDRQARRDHGRRGRHRRRLAFSGPGPTHPRPVREPGWPWPVERTTPLPARMPPDRAAQCRRASG